MLQIIKRETNRPFLIIKNEWSALAVAGEPSLYLLPKQTR